MMCQNYESDVFPYRTLEEMAPYFFNVGGYFDLSNGFAEGITDYRGMYVSGDEVYVIALTDQWYAPGSDQLRYGFGLQSGDFHSRTRVPVTFGTLNTTDIVQGGGGQFYAKVLSVVDVYRVDFDFIAFGSAIPPSRFGLATFSSFYFDELRNRALVWSSTNSINVHRFDDGDLIRSIFLPHSVVQITQCFDSTVFMLLENKGIVLVNYETGEVLSYTKVPQVSTASSAQLFAWSAEYQRLYFLMESPDVSGVNTTRVAGFRYTPIATHLCTPIPLTPLRNGRRSNVLIKQIGDFGEGLPGSAVVSVTGSAARVVSPQVGFDGDGEAVAIVEGLDEGTASASVSAEVSCLF